jgi:hypothetical protein
MGGIRASCCSSAPTRLQSRVPSALATTTTIIHRPSGVAACPGNLQDDRGAHFQCPLTTTQGTSTPYIHSFLASFGII